MDVKASVDTPLEVRRESAIQLIALSAVLEDLNRLDEWLGMGVLMSDQRPVDLYEGIVRKDGTFTYRSFIAKEIGTEQFTPFPAPYHLQSEIR